MSDNNIENINPNLPENENVPGIEFKDIRQEENTAPQPPEETIGEILKRARLEKGIDFNKIYESTKLRRAYIEALENNDFRGLPNLLVARGYMKIYADFLGLPVTELIEKFNNLFPQEATGSNGPRNPKEKETKFGIFIPKKMLVPTSLKNMNVSGFRYSQESKVRTNKKLIYSIALAAGFVISAIILSNLYFKSSIGAIKSTPRQEAEVGTLEAKMTPEMLQSRGIKYNKVTVIAKANARTYLMVVMDGRMVFRGNLESNGSKYWEADQYVRIKAATPRNLMLVVNGEDIGKMSDQMIMEEKTFYPLKPGEPTGNPVLKETAEQNQPASVTQPQNEQNQPEGQKTPASGELFTF